MKNCATEGTFGTLGAAMRCAYLLADGLKEWQADSDGGAVGGGKRGKSGGAAGGVVSCEKAACSNEHFDSSSKVDV